LGTFGIVISVGDSGNANASIHIHDMKILFTNSDYEYAKIKNIYIPYRPFGTIRIEKNYFSIINAAKYNGNVEFINIDTTLHAPNSLGFKGIYILKNILIIKITKITSPDNIITTTNIYFKRTVRSAYGDNGHEIDVSGNVINNYIFSISHAQMFASGLYLSGLLETTATICKNNVILIHTYARNTTENHLQIQSI
jgi:hypothetical protein